MSTIPESVLTDIDTCANVTYRRGVDDQPDAAERVAAWLVQQAGERTPEEIEQLRQVFFAGCWAAGGISNPTKAEAAFQRWLTRRWCQKCGHAATWAGRVWTHNTPSKDVDHLPDVRSNQS